VAGRGVAERCVPRNALSGNAVSPTPLPDAVSRSKTSFLTASNLSRARQIQLPRDRIARGTDGREQAVECAAAARQRAEEAAALEDLDFTLEQIE